MARLRRMYARLLFVVVGISGAVLVRGCFGAVDTPARTLPPGLPTGFAELRLGIPGRCGYTLAS